ncbi:unnamed protein product [Brassica napus]|uniref:(rape) hypothetical protein n=1 Tax=Brassica napus TaxID=3708 RepID=A0A816K3F3_BRANA|nr:unnamed protein product [Brassica napus]
MDDGKDGAGKRDDARSGSGGSILWVWRFRRRSRV